jgi:hypothetical protein
VTNLKNWRHEIISSIICTALLASFLFALFMLFGNIHDQGGWFLYVLLAPMGLISRIFGRIETGWTFFFAVELGSLFLLVIATRLVWKRVLGRYRK